MDKLIRAIIAKKNPTVVGLDPKLDFIPAEMLEQARQGARDTFAAAGEALWLFNKAIIDCTYDLVPAVKPQSAYYEMYGIAGLKALSRTIDYAREKGLYVILDAKRGDIGTTAEAYSAAYLGETPVFGENLTARRADCLTVNPYLGIDGVKPFIDDCKKFDNDIFVLVKTSNKSSGDFQDLTLANGKPLYEEVGAKVAEWGADSIGECGYSRVGAVVGATYPQQLEILRKALPHTFFLIPGYGAQGGKGSDLAVGFGKNGLGAIVNSSRGIMCAYQKSSASFTDATREAVIEMKNDLQF